MRPLVRVQYRPPRRSTEPPSRRPSGRCEGPVTDSSPVDQGEHPETAGGPRRRRIFEELRHAVGAAVVGGDSALRLAAVALVAEGHALLEDVPGTGKTLMARAIAKALTLETARVQGTPDLLPSDITGSSVFESG